MKILIKAINKLHVFLYRAFNGKVWGSMMGAKVILLITTGRKTGKKRTTPLGAFAYKNGYVIVASGGGQKLPAWYLNLDKSPNVEIQVDSQHIKVRAEVLQGEERAAVWELVTTQSPSYKRFEGSTKFEIPLIWLRPQ